MLLYSVSRSKDWGEDTDGNCYNQTTPIEDLSYWGAGTSKGVMRVIGEVFSTSKIPVGVVNITQLSEYRKDAHTQIYKKQWNPLTPQQLANPKSYADCTHWCLPGLQDTWNELLYSKLFFPWAKVGAHLEFDVLLILILSMTENESAEMGLGVMLENPLADIV
jgi:hypothetical protein